MQITIHRGTHQIGGCATEIATDRAQVFIDFGADLPGEEAQTPPGPIPGLTSDGCPDSALFFTHYHGDHTGRLREVRPGMPVYMAATAREIFLRYLARTDPDCRKIAESILPCSPLRKVQIGDISVTPFIVDHSALDSCMFLIEADGKRVLHTGDFRLHGFRGAKTLPMLRRYAQDIDCVICETTSLSGDDTPMVSERELQAQAREVMREYKYVFVMCSSTNIDRIGLFYHANPRGRLFVCDNYQKDLLDIVHERYASRSPLYDFSHVLSYGSNLDPLMEDRGFCMLIRRGPLFSRLLDRYRGRSLTIYSMWEGYLEQDEELSSYLAKENMKILHTSGHAWPEDIAALCREVNPKIGVIPIHGSTPDRLSELLPEEKVILLQDGEQFTLPQAPD